MSDMETALKPDWAMRLVAVSTIWRRRSSGARRVRRGALVTSADLFFPNPTSAIPIAAPLHACRFFPAGSTGADFLLAPIDRSVNTVRVAGSDRCR